MNEQLLRQPSVTELTAVPRSTMYAWARAGKFPKPVKIGERAAAWRRSEIEAWIAARAAQRDAAA